MPGWALAVRAIIPSSCPWPQISGEGGKPMSRLLFAFVASRFCLFFPFRLCSLFSEPDFTPHSQPYSLSLSHCIHTVIE
ncbi:hypothetical protein BJY04DRAFT_196748 [Aspergillus karnatakaensis]|uniref:uncharacterized protein n=1 Tax=Aspergillus karnatakaensis TaxID=1810916 RepID=UPI003CCDBA3E